MRSVTVALSSNGSVNWPGLSWNGRANYLALVIARVTTGQTITGIWDLKTAQSTAFPGSPLEFGTVPSRPHVVFGLTEADVMNTSIESPKPVALPKGAYRISVISDAPVTVTLPLTGYRGAPRLTARASVDAAVQVRDNTPPLGAPGLLMASSPFAPSSRQSLRVTASVVVVEGAQHVLQGVPACLDGALPPLCGGAVWSLDASYDIGHTVTSQNIPTDWSAVFFVVDGWDPALSAGSHTATVFFPSSRQFVKVLSYSLVAAP